MTRKLVLASTLALLAIGLMVADRLRAGDSPAVNDFAAAHADAGQINAVVDTMLQRYAVDLRAITTWKVQTPDKKLLRMEQRVVVPHEFPSVKFNYELNQQLLPLAARIAATERSKENVVTMHVVSHGVIIRSMSFAMRPHELVEPPDRGSNKRTASVH